jgi:RNA polymerase sigma-70 factor (ECF subfamily)
MNGGLSDHTAMLRGENRLLALHALFEELRPVLYAIALQMLGHGDDARDAMQETFVKAVTHINTLKDPQALGGWLKAILRNQCLMELRYRKRRALSETAYYKTADMVADAYHESEHSPYRVQQAIANLSETLQVTAMLRFYGRFNSYEQMAEILSVPVGTVRSRLAEARTRLASSLGTSNGLVTKSAKATEMEEFYFSNFSTIYADIRAKNEMLKQMDDDILIILSSGKKVRGTYYIDKQIEYDLYHGARATLKDVYSTGHISILEIDNINPPDDPTVCPPASTFVMVHPGFKADKMYFHNAAQASMALE